MRSLREPLVQAAAMAAVLVGFCLHARLAPMPLFPVDDAYITAHNADVLRTGTDPQYSSSLTPRTCRAGCSPRTAR